MHKEAAIAVIAILLIVLLSQTAAVEYSKFNASEGIQSECERLYNQCVSCEGARVCRYYCYAYEGRCL